MEETNDEEMIPDAQGCTVRKGSVVDSLVYFTAMCGAILLFLLHTL